jgi:DNA-binding GntR family transcriptional regulator
MPPWFQGGEEGMSVLTDADEIGSAAAVYRELKQRILNVRYAVGERMSEARLAEELGVGRSPIRTALLRLKAEGWIAISPQSGTYIRSMTRKEIRDVTDLRLILEMRVARDAAKLMTVEAVKKLQGEFRDKKRRIVNGDVDAFLKIDERLHSAIYEAADNKLISQILVGLRDKVQWLRRTGAVSSQRVQDSFAEIESLFQAIKKRDEKAAAQAMHSHLQNSFTFIEKLRGSDKAD